MTDLAQSLLSEELRSLLSRHWSGVLSLSSGEVTKGLFLLEGRIVFAASTLNEDKLGETLVRTGRISRDQLAEAYRDAQAASRRLGLALVGAGVMSANEIEAAVAAQVERIVLSVLQWTEGALLYLDTEKPIADELALDLSTQRLLLEGARAFPDVARLERALGDTSRRVRTADPEPFDYGSLPGVPIERRLLQAASSERRIAELLALPAARPELVRGIYALLVGGLLQELDLPKVAIKKPTAAASAQPTVVDEHVDPAERARVLLERGEKRQAIELLRDVVVQAPGDAFSHRLLAIALEGEPAFSPEAERQFLRALELQPKDQDLRYRLAAYYRKWGLHARAVLQLKLVLGRDPHHAPAWRDLSELEGGAAKPRRGH